MKISQLQVLFLLANCGAAGDARDVPTLLMILVMAPQRWRVSDWASCKGVTIYRGGSEPITRDMQLGNLRDTYYEGAYGSLEQPQEVDASKVVQLDNRQSGKEAARSRKRPN